MLEPAVRKIFEASPLSQDPARSNVFMFVLDPQGKVVHSFHGLPAGRGRPDPGRSRYDVEIRKALEGLQVPPVAPTGAVPDLPAAADGKPGGVRLFIRREASRLPVVEVVPMATDDWKPLAYSPEPRVVPAEALRQWLGQLYPPAIRATDALKPFRVYDGVLRLEPAGSEGSTRYAVLRGTVRLSKADETESAFEGTVEAVLTYTADAPEPRSVRGLVEGTYLYRQRGEMPLKLTALIESRPR